MKRIKLTKKKITLLLLVLFAGVAAAFILRTLNSPAEGVVVIPKAATDTKTEPAKERIVGKHITFAYPGRYEQVSNQNPSASLEYWIIVARRGLGIGQSGQIAMTLVNLPEGGVKEDSSYKHTHAFTDLYKLSDAAINSEPTVVATRTDPSYERTVLWPHGKLLLTATLTSASESEELVAEFDEVLRSVAWQP